MTILLCGLINIIGFYCTARLISNAMRMHYELRDRLQMIEVEVLDMRKQLRFKNV